MILAAALDNWYYGSTSNRSWPLGDQGESGFALPLFSHEDFHGQFASMRRIIFFRVRKFLFMECIMKRIQLIFLILVFCGLSVFAQKSKPWDRVDKERCRKNTK